jgi:hypothetical protein
MKTLAAILLAVGLTQSAHALQPSSTQSPLIGRWSVDTSRLPVPPDARPKSVTITFDDAGNGKWTIHVDIVDAGGTERHSMGTPALDGSATPVSGSDEADTVAVKSPVPNVLVMALAKNHMPASTRVYSVVADGASMVETAAYFDHDGLAVMRTNYFTRIR